MTTLRDWLMKIGAKVLRHGHPVIFKSRSPVGPLPHTACRRSPDTPARDASSLILICAGN
jgi:hypothetical protein